MKKYAVKEIKALLNEKVIDNSLLESFRVDERKGVINEIKIYDRRIAKEKLVYDNFLAISNFDAQYRQQGYLRLAGVDEAGRGPLAGPVVAAAVILPEGFELIGLTDSKKVKEIDRKRFFDIITNSAISYEIAIVNNDIIDEINILEATKRAMHQALVGLDVQPDIALIDAVKINNLPFPSDAIIKGDDKSLAIAAASILAKVTRDNIMEKIAEEFPGYDFSNNKGYGTEKHLNGMAEFGITKYHRKTFSPVNQYAVK